MNRMQFAIRGLTPIPVFGIGCLSPQLPRPPKQHPSSFITFGERNAITVSQGRRKMKKWILLTLGLVALSSIAAAQPQNLELFLFIGQSNMAGRGVVEPQDREPIPGVFMLNKELAWTPALDPVHFDKPIAGVGIARSFAKVLVAAKPDSRLGLIPAAVGGTSLEQWKPGGELYTEAVRRTRAAMKSGRLRGILWHQGESECGSAEKAKSYGERFAKLATALREEFGMPDLPILVGELGEYLYDRPKNTSPFARVVNEQLALIPLSVPHSGFVSSAGLTHGGDVLHFNAAGLREFGRRYGHAFLALDPAWTN